MSKPSTLLKSFATPLVLISINLSARSFMSITRFQTGASKYKEDGIYKVDANITVGLDDFNTYLNEILAFGSNIDSYSDSICMNYFGYDLVCNKDFSFFKKYNLSTDSTFLIPFEISLKNSFIRKRIFGEGLDALAS